MKKIITIIALLFTVLISNSQAVSNAMRATIVSEATNQITAYAKSDVNLTNVHVNNVIVSLSIIDPGVGNRPTLSIVTNHLPYCAWTPQAPYAEGGRWHYDFIANNNSNAPGINTITWAAQSHNRLLTVSFSNSNGFNTTRIDNWDAPNWGQFFNSMFYFELIQAGNGDITAQNNIFYGTVGVVNDPGGVNSGTSFAPIQPIIVVPVKFLSFLVTKENNDAKLIWAVENQNSAVKHFEIERSFNGISFTKIADQNPTPTTNGYASYNLTDAGVFDNFKGTVYYRIKQVDFSGVITYSIIRNLKLTSKAFALSLYPNPVVHAANLVFNLEKAQPVTITLIDGVGKTISNYSMQAAKGINQKNIDVKNLAAGTYTFIIKTENDMENIIFVKSN